MTDRSDPQVRDRVRRTAVFEQPIGRFPRLDRLQNAISTLCGIVAAGSILTIVIVTLGEIVARTLFDSPLGWSVGLIEQYLMVSVAFFGMVTAYRCGAHVAVVSLFAKVPAPVQKLFLIVGLLLISGCLGFMLVAGWRATAFALSIAEIVPPGMAELSIPAWTWRAIVPTASALGLVVVVIDLYKELRTGRLETVADDKGGATHQGTDDDVLVDSQPTDSAGAALETGGHR